jgi:hypothetical protein
MIQVRAPHPIQSAIGVLGAGEPFAPAHRTSMRSIRSSGSIKNRAASCPSTLRLRPSPLPRSRGQSRQYPWARP